MRTLVFQSYRPTGVPPWIARCLDTVRLWAEGAGFDYRLLGDELFSGCPPEYEAKVGGSVVLRADLGRLQWARRLLAEGHERVVWVDADVLVFAPQALRIDITEEYAFCREVWLAPRPGGASYGEWVNNAVAVFCRGNSLLDFYIHACKAIVQSAPGPVPKLAVGTHFLSALHRQLRFRLLESVGLLSPVVLADVAGGGGRFAAAYRRAFGQPIAAANLCASLVGEEHQGVRLDEKRYDAAVAVLLNSAGAAINGHGA